MDGKGTKENLTLIQPSMERLDINVQLSADIHKDISEQVISDGTDITDATDVLSTLKRAPETPSIRVNSRFEPPVYGLPQSVQNVINEICTKKQVPTEFVLSPLLAVAGAAAGRHSVLDSRSYDNPPCFWCVVIADPGSNKSYPQRLICSSLNEINQNLAKEYDEKIREWKTLCAVQTKKSKNRNVPHPPKPLKCRVCVSDTTREALTEILVGSPDGLCQIRDELSGWLDDIGRYGKSGEVATYLSYWTGEGIINDRKSEDCTAWVDGVLYNICGTIQPGILADSFNNKQYLKSGFMQRFMFFWPQNVQKKKIERTPTVPDMSSWKNLVNNLYGLRKQKIRLELSDAANEIIMAYENEIEDIKATTEYAYEKGVVAKLDIIAFRLACVARMLAIADGDSSHEVTATEMKWAVDLCRYLHQTQMRVYEELQSGNRERNLMNDKELIRAFLKRFESRGVTQGKLAKLLGISQSYISQCVNPKVKPIQETESQE